MKRYFIALALIGVCFNLSKAQSDNFDDNHAVAILIPEVAILDVEGGNNISLSVKPPTEAGDAVDFSEATDNSTWLNYSSVVGTSETVRSVSARITKNSIPGGMILKVIASADAGNGDGTLGSSSGNVTLTSTNQTVISGIGSCYTGDGLNNGHNLTYSLELDPTAGSYASINFDEDVNVTITYTISNN